MATAIIVIVILIFFLIILPVKCEFRIISEEGLKVELSFVFFKFELKSFKERGSKRKIRLSAIRSSLGFLLKHSELSFNKTALSEHITPLALGISRALFSIIFAYLALRTDKISLPTDVDACRSIFEFDISLKTRLIFIISALIIYKTKAKFGGKARSVR